METGLYYNYRSLAQDTTSSGLVNITSVHKYPRRRVGPTRRRDCCRFVLQQIQNKSQQWSLRIKPCPHWRVSTATTVVEKGHLSPNSATMVAELNRLVSVYGDLRRLRYSRQCGRGFMAHLASIVEVDKKSNSTLSTATKIRLLFRRHCGTFSFVAVHTELCYRIGQG